MTAELDCSAARALCAAATPGPWWPRYGGEAGHVYSSSAKLHLATVHAEMSDAVDQPDSRFIAAARTLLPAALDRIAELETERDAARGLAAALEAELARVRDAVNVGATPALIAEILDEATDG